MERGRRSFDRPPDDRLREFRELRRMRGRQENARLGHTRPTAFSTLRTNAEIADGRVRIDQTPGAIVDVLDRGAYRAVFEPATGDVAADAVAVAAVQPHEALEVARVADVH